MTRYRKGDTIVDAVQFDPHEYPWPDGAVNWADMPYQPRDMSFGYIETAEGRTHILAGNWIVTDEAGKHLLSDAVFKAKYEPVNDEKIAGSFLVGDGWDQGEIVPEIESAYFADVPRPEIVSLPKGAPVYPITLPLSEDALRKMIEDAVQRALYPAGTISGHEHRRVEMVEESGKRWRGVLYPVDVYKTDPMVQAVREAVPTGVCWACKRPGESVAMTWYGTHLIHNTDECRELAGRTPEQREHRG